MQTDTDERRLFIESVLSRLRRHYAERTPIPGGDEDPAMSMSLPMLQRLYKYVISEGYGE